MVKSKIMRDLEQSIRSMSFYWNVREIGPSKAICDMQGKE